MKPTYDYLIVGAGLFGSVFAHEMNKRGKKCLVLEKRSHIGGNTYCENIDGINVHKYGPHIFHTNDQAIWDYVNAFVPFNRFTYSPLASYGGKFYNLPFNMNTFYQVWGLQSPSEVQRKIEAQRIQSKIKQPQNLEEQAISLVGQDLYEMFIKGYTEKQWGRACRDLPSFIIKRLPVRFTYNNNYFNDKFQGIPIGGYNKLSEALLEGIEVRLGVNYFESKAAFDLMADKVVYTGPIDTFFDDQFGELQYRSLRFKTEVLEEANVQGNAVINYSEAKVPYTRIIEHKHFEFGRQKHTVITREYPQAYRLGRARFYPINDAKNNAVYQRYKQLAQQNPKYIFGGRLAEYKYYDMHQVIASALTRVKQELIKAKASIRELQLA